MGDTDKQKPPAEVSTHAAPSTTGHPLVFISHDARDAELAEAFAKLLRSVSAGMIKTFRSSDKKGGEGIDFGEEWYKRLMSKLLETSHVVCLFTERSVDRPWILFEAGVAKGKLNTPVTGVALGVPLSRFGTGPFYNFHNLEDSEEELSKLVHQLARGVQGVELDPDVVKSQVALFKASEAEILKKLGAATVRREKAEPAEDNSIAKLVEEMKALPSRVAERLAESDGTSLRRRRMRRLHPIMLEELLHTSGAEPGDPVAILLVASLVRDEAPWLYELTMEVYRAVKSGDPAAIEKEMERLLRFSERPPHPLMEELGFGGKESYFFFREFPRMLEHMLRRTQLQLGTKGEKKRERRSPLE
jgi:hypothetical protein